MCNVTIHSLLQVPLGVITKCETKTDDMIDILTELHKYVPVETSTRVCIHPRSGNEVQYVEDVFHHILFGGDQLTIERIRTAQSTRANSNRQEDKFMGFLPVTEDWHAQVMLLTVSQCAAPIIPHNVTLKILIVN